MKKNVLLITLPALLLLSCSGGENSLSSSISGSDSDLSSSEVSPSLSPNDESDLSSSEDIHIPSEIVGTWYITSTFNGVLPLNGIFDITSEDTLLIGEQTLSLSGHYEEESDFLFVYGTINFIVSYDAEKDGVDWGYQNGETWDMGFSSSEPLSTKYAYEGASFPLAMINDYLSTDGDIPAMSAGTYKLRLYNSSLYDADVAAVEMMGTTLQGTMDYIAALQEAGFVFPSYLGSLSASSFAEGYDQSKTYFVRIIFFENEDIEDETDLFVYNYSDSYFEKENSAL